jgi:hypothetical protein
MALSSSPGIFVLGSLAFLFGLYVIFINAKRYLLFQKISNTPTSKVEAVAVGLVEVSGTAVAKEPVKSPISGADCVYWRLETLYHYARRQTKNLFRFESNDLFYIEDGTGKLLVDPKDSKIDIQESYSSRRSATYEGVLSARGEEEPIDPRVQAFIDAQSPYVRKRFEDVKRQHLRVEVTETFIADGDPLYVLGRAEPIDGKAGERSHENLVIRKGNVEKMMYISNTSERELQGDLKSSSGNILSGLGISVISIVVLLWYYGAFDTRLDSNTYLYPYVDPIIYVIIGLPIVFMLGFIAYVVYRMNAWEKQR